MKRTLMLFAIMAICSAMMLSCKNNNNEPTPAEIEAQKVTLADSVLAKIDEIAEQFFVDSEGKLFEFELTETEKLNKPDYLLELSYANNFVTRSQKINALGMYLVDHSVRVLYDMPLDESKALIEKLAIDINLPISNDVMSGERKASEIIKESYNACKEQGDVSLFWQLQTAIILESDYIIANNPELYFGKISEEDLTLYGQRWIDFDTALWTLAPYDEEINQIYQNRSGKTEEEIAAMAEDFATVEKCIETYKADKYHAISDRNALLQ